MCTYLLTQILTWGSALFTPNNFGRPTVQYSAKSRKHSTRIKDHRTSFTWMPLSGSSSFQCRPCMWGRHLACSPSSLERLRLNPHNGPRRVCRDHRDDHSSHPHGYSPENHKKGIFFHRFSLNSRWSKLKNLSKLKDFLLNSSKFNS